MEYANITLDIGAALNAYKFLWGNLEKFSNVAIHIGDFHYLKENFYSMMIYSPVRIGRPSPPQPFFKKYNPLLPLINF